MAPFFMKLATLAGIVVFAFAADDTYYNPKIENPTASDELYVPNRWSVVFYDGNVTSTMAQRHYDETSDKYDGQCTLTGLFNINNFQGYTLTADVSVVNEIASSNLISYISRSAVAYTSAIITQEGSTYGLARLSRREAPATTRYFYDESAGAGSTVYVLDTGVTVEAPEFETRATWGQNFIPGEGLDDGNGHGTHVAGTVASKTWGVAKKANIIAVKVLPAGGRGGGYTVDALSWVINDVQRNGRQNVVINYSVGGPYDRAEQEMWNAAIGAGITCVTAAGNGLLGVGVGLDLSVRRNDTAWPAQNTRLITVGSIDINNERASSSNFGSPVDVWAPGVGVISVRNVATNATQSLTGTSMSSPHIAGLAAYLLVLEKLPNPEAVRQRIVDLATTGEVRNRGNNSPDLIGFNNFDGVRTTTSTSSTSTTTTTRSTSTSFTTTTSSVVTSDPVKPTSAPYKPAPTPYKPKGKGKKPIGGHARL
ncbi:hypothetical protein HYALB_00004757 [Hymenoscyphus albidus]|uniref:Peptidase S8/S53 domain-containing protein n=1 Tax=Hymenoscyphus albidus TaxID=595503 RepID=A0A9N9LV55_9HELO|nr:hypothetical protein HYALB_00004757 [Hymenoscyphus albidus]